MRSAGDFMRAAWRETIVTWLTCRCNAIRGAEECRLDGGHDSTLPTQAGTVLPRVLPIVLAWFGFVHAAAGLAQDGYFDTAWGNGGRLLVDVTTGDDDRLSTLLHQPDGKLLMFGTCKPSGIASLCAARVHGNGGLDMSFGAGSVGTASYGMLAGSGWKAVSLASGGTVVAGGQPARMARLLPSGLLDASFGGGTGYAPVNFAQPGATGQSVSHAAAVGVQADGKVLVAGFAVIASRQTLAVARWLPDLSALDMSFGGGDALAPPGVALVDLDAGNTYHSESVVAVSVQADGRIVLAASAAINGGNDMRYRAAAARLLPDGQLDTSFASAGRFILPALAQVSVQLTGVVLDQRGRIMLAGASKGTTGGWNFFVLRLLPSGALDTGFGLLGWQEIAFDMGAYNDDRVESVAVQSDGRIVLAGYANVVVNPAHYGETRFAVARLRENGSLDGAFGIGGRSTGSFSTGPTSLEVHVAGGITFGNGGLVVAGYGTSANRDFRFGLARLRLDLVFSGGFEPR